MYHISYKTFLALVLSILPFQWLVSIHLPMYCVALVVYNIITHVPLLLGRSLHIRYSITEIGRDILDKQRYNLADAVAIACGIERKVLNLWRDDVQVSDVTKCGVTSMFDHRTLTYLTWCIAPSPPCHSSFICQSICEYCGPPHCK